MGVTEGNLVKRGKYFHWRFCVDGKPTSLSLKVKTRAEAQRVRQALMAEYNDKPHALLGAKANPTLEDFWKEVSAWGKAHKRKASQYADERAWNMLTNLTDAQRVGDVTPRMVEGLKEKLKRDGTKGRPLSDASVNQAMRSLRAVWNQGIKLDLYHGSNPFAGIRLYKITKTLPDFLTLDECERLLTAAWAHSHELYWVMLLGLYAGLRKNEMVNARWDWFDFDERLLKVKRYTGAFELKDHEERIIPMSARLVHELRPHAKPDGYVFESPRRSEGKSRYRYDPKKSFRLVAEAADVERATFHLLRHTFGSQHAIAGTSIYKISKWMGHSSVDVTAKHYAGLQEYDGDIDRL